MLRAEPTGDIRKKKRDSIERIDKNRTKLEKKTRRENQIQRAVLNSKR